MGCLASFQNSRVKPRKATETAQTGTLSVPTASEIQMRPANPNRTYLTIRNLDQANPVRYGYPAQFGTLATNGFLLKGGDAADLESTQEIRIIAFGAAVEVVWDEGSG